MKKYEIEISVVGKETFFIEADSAAEAEVKARAKYEKMIEKGYHLDTDLDVNVDYLKEVTK